MDAERLVRGLPLLFDDFPRSEHPRDRRFARVVEEVENLTRENNLALLNLAVSLLGEGETFVEVGSFHGASLVAALLGNETRDVVAVDAFTFRDASRASLEANLRRFGLEPPEILEGDVFELLPGGALGGRRVGLYYYDAAHDYDSQLRALQVAEPWLAPGAVLLVDDSDWEDVAGAVEDYLAGQPRASRLFEIGGSSRGQPWWWEGVVALRWNG